MTRSGLSRAITALTTVGLVMSAAFRSRGMSSNHPGQPARHTSAPPCPPAPKTRTFTKRLLRGHLVSSSGVRAEQLVEIVNGTREAVFQGYLGMPAQDPLGFGDIGTTLDRIVDGKWPAGDLGARACHLDDHAGELGNRGLDRVAEVDWAGDVVGGGHQR